MEKNKYVYACPMDCLKSFRVKCNGEIIAECPHDTNMNNCYFAQNPQDLLKVQQINHDTAQNELRKDNPLIASAYFPTEQELLASLKQ